MLPSRNPQTGLYVAVAVGIILLVLLWAWVANAQETVLVAPTVANEPWWESLAETLLPLAATALAAVGTALGGFAIQWVATKTKLDRTTIDAVAGPVLDLALKNGIELALDAAAKATGISLLDTEEVIRPKVEQEVVAAAVEYARKTVPDKIETLKVDKMLPELAKARVGKVLNNMRAARRAARQERREAIPPLPAHL